MEPITTTLNRIRARSPCEDGWQKLLAHLGKTAADDEPLPYSVIVASNGISDALWCCRAEPDRPEWRVFARWCALQVVHLWDCPEIVRRYLETGDETIRNAARAATLIPECVAIDASSWATWAASWATIKDASWSAERSASCVHSCAIEVDAAREAQKSKFLEMVG